jgi:hypothetical protein
MLSLFSLLIACSFLLRDKLVKELVAPRVNSISIGYGECLLRIFAGCFRLSRAPVFPLCADATSSCDQDSEDLPYCKHISTTLDEKTGVSSHGIAKCVSSLTTASSHLFSVLPP